MRTATMGSWEWAKILAESGPKAGFNRDETESIDIAWVGGFVTAVNRFGYGSSGISPFWSLRELAT
jgi:hypothetical protein